MHHYIKINITDKYPLILLKYISLFFLYKIDRTAIIKPQNIAFYSVLFFNTPDCTHILYRITQFNKLYSNISRD